MSQSETTILTTQPLAHNGGADAAHAHDHTPNLAHHFESLQQQTDAGKLGMWVFLATEILMFGGLFCWYAVWRAGHYDIFEIGHNYLNTWWGAVNTIILLASSFTMAWGVRAAQLNKRTLCWVLLLLTFLGGVGFMCIKYVEYTTKFEHGMGPGAPWYTVPVLAEHLYEGPQNGASADAAHAGPAGGQLIVAAGEHHGRHEEYHGPKIYAEHVSPERAVEIAAAMGVVLDNEHEVEQYAHHLGEQGAYFNHYGHTPHQLATARSFFSIYFALTGLHGLHVLVGMALVAWVMVRAYNGAFNSEYNAPVDIVGLYWHLVDLIWIFLFPLLYLI